MTSYMQMLKISGYGEQYRHEVLRGVLQRYQELLEMEERGETKLYRNREEMKQSKEEKGGTSAASWFLRGTTTSTLLTSTTPGNLLAKSLRKCTRTQKTVDGGDTLVIEAGGQSILSGLTRKDPFRQEGCKYQEKCLIAEGSDCSRTATCYVSTCHTCQQKADSLRELAKNTSDDAEKKRLVSEAMKTEAIYIGMTGRSLHARSVEHARAISSKSKKNALSKHQARHHQNTEHNITIKPVTAHTSVLTRTVTEALLIDSASRREGLMNSKSEWGRGKLIRRRIEVLSC